MTNVQGDVRRFDLVTLGEPLICLTAPDGRLPATRMLAKSVAGAESNLAIGLARLGRNVAMLSRVGDDPLGDEIIRTLRGEGVDTRWIVRDESSPSGLMIKERRGPDDIHVFYYRHGSAAAQLRPHDVAVEALHRAARVHVTGITLALGEGPRAAVEELLTTAKELGLPVSFDPNFRLKLWSVEDAAKVCASLLPAVSDLLVGEDELLAMAEAAGVDRRLDAAFSWLANEFELASVVVKQGARGAVGMAGDVWVDRPAHRVPAVVDTVGAGDAFNAGYIHALMSGQGFAAAVDVGLWVAGRVVSHFGDYEGLPDATEFAAYVSDREPVQR